MKRMTPSAIIEAIRVGLPFTAAVNRQQLTAVRVEVLSSHLGMPGEPLSGPLAEQVRQSVRNYTMQYRTGGGRRRPPNDVVYFIAQFDPAARSHYVLALVTANGGIEHVTEAEQPPACREVLAAIVAGLPAAAKVIAQAGLRDDGLHPNEFRDESGQEFALFTRPSAVPIYRATQAAVFESREAAYAALRAAEASDRHAWVEQYETSGPLYAVALGHGSADCLGEDLVTEVTRNPHEAKRAADSIQAAQPGAIVALAIRTPEDSCYRVDGAPVSQWMRLLADPGHENGV